MHKTWHLSLKQRAKLSHQEVNSDSSTYHLVTFNLLLRNKEVYFWSYDRICLSVEWVVTTDKQQTTWIKKIPEWISWKCWCGLYSELGFASLAIVLMVTTSISPVRPPVSSASSSPHWDRERERRREYWWSKNLFCSRTWQYAWRRWIKDWNTLWKIEIKIQ